MAGRVRAALQKAAAWADGRGGLNLRRAVPGGDGEQRELAAQRLGEAGALAVGAVDLSENELGRATPEQLRRLLAAAARAAPSAREVSLRRNAGFGPAGGVEAVAQTFLTACDIARLNLSACDLDDDHVRALTLAPNFGRIKALTLRGNSALTQASVQALAESAAKPNSLLTEVSGLPVAVNSSDLDAALHRNRRRAAAERIDAALASTTGTCSLGVLCDDEDAEHAASRIASHTTAPIALGLRGARLSQSGARALAKAVHDCVHVVRVDTDMASTVDDNEAQCAVRTLCGAAAANRLRAALAGPSTDHPLLAGALTALRSIGNTPLGCEGAQELAGVLRMPSQTPWHGLTSLGVHTCELEAEGASALLDALASYNALTELVAYGNAALGDSGVRSIAAHIHGGSLPLRALDVGACSVGDAGAHALAEAIAAPRCVLNELHVDHNAIEHVAATVLAQSAIDSGRVHTLWRQGNPGFDGGELAEAAAAAAEGATVLQDDPRAALPVALAVAMARARARASVRAASDHESPLDDCSAAPRPSRSIQPVDIAECAIHAYLKHAGSNHARLLRGGQAVLAAYVMESPATLETVAFGAGTKFVPRGLARADARANLACVCDSHAEVLATRMLRRFLWHELEKLGKRGGGSSVLALTSSGVVPCAGVCFHLYISTAPCGMASLPSDVQVCLPCRPGSLCKGTPAKHGKQCWPPGCAGLARPRGSHAAESLSCTDKVFRWITCGFEGAMLSGILDTPLRIASLVLARKFKPGLAAAWLCPPDGDDAVPQLIHTDVRLEPALLSAGYGQGDVGGMAGDGDECASWCAALGDFADVHDGRTGLHPPGVRWSCAPDASREATLAAARAALAEHDVALRFERVRQALDAEVRDAASYRRMKEQAASEGYCARKARAAKWLNV